MKNKQKNKRKLYTCSTCKACDTTSLTTSGFACLVSDKDISEPHIDSCDLYMNSIEKVDFIKLCRNEVAQ